MVIGATNARRAAEDLERALDPTVTGVELLPLAVHRSAGVRAAVASRVDCPMGALLALGHDRSVDVLLALIANLRAPDSLIRQLAESRHDDVRSAALSRMRRSIA